MPFFSILIPSYNRPLELKRNIESIISGTFTDYEIIISDDNSPKADDIRRVVSEYDGIDNIKFFSQSKNLKEPENKNFLVNEATGKFNIVLGDDDTFNSNSLKVIYDFIHDNPHFDIYGLGYNIVDEAGSLLSTHKSPVKLDLKDDFSRRLITEAGSLPMMIFHPATFCCASGVEKSLPYRTDVGIGEDMCFIVESVLLNKSFCVIPGALFNWRKVQDKNSVDQGNQSAEAIESINSKIKIYEVLKNKKYETSFIADYIETYEYRKKFIYTEILRQKKNKLLDLDELIKYPEMEMELRGLRKSTLFSLGLRLLRVIRFIEITRIMGVSSIFLIKDRFKSWRRNL